MGRRAQAALVPHQGAARRQAELIAALAQKVTAEERTSASPPGVKMGRKAPPAPGA